MLPVIPLVWAARAAGHEVLVATTSEMAEVGANTGLPVVDVVPEHDIWADQMRRLKEGPSEDDEHLPPEYRAALAAHNPFGLFALIMTEGSISAGREFNPDLVVYTSDHVAGALTAAALGVPALEAGNRVSWSMRDADFKSRASFVGEEVLESLRRKNKIPDAAPKLLARIDPRPASMGGLPAGDEPDSDDGVPWWPMSFVPYNGGAVIPDWARTRPARPRVCVTLGTVVPMMSGTDSLTAVIDVLGKLDVDVVLATGTADLGALGALPENVTPVGFVPLSAVLPTCSLIVHHGGSGTTASPMFYGVPQLVLPSFADNPMSAQRVADRGIGLQHDPSTVDAATLRESITRLLTEPSFTQAAAEVAAEMSGQPSPADVIGRAVGVLRGN